jgi:diacylglycerol O-acyltransferase
VNDVILAGVAGGLRRLLEERREAVEHALVAMVPVSTRSEGEGGALGNQISAMLVSLATDVDDPVQRLTAIADSTRVAKEQEQLASGTLLGDLAQIAAPGLVSRLARAVAGHQAVRPGAPSIQRDGLGVKGPDFPLFCAGSRVTSMCPVGPVAEGVGLNVTIFSYLDRLHFGLLGLPQAPPRTR